MIPESCVIHQTKLCLQYEKSINVNVQEAENIIDKNWALHYGKVSAKDKED